jgi:HlyD family secretion protein
MLRDLQVTEAELRQQRNALRERLARLDIRAPASGIVYGLTVFAERAVIRTAEPLLFVIPQDRPLVVASRVQPINGDEVWPGQDVRLRIAALDARSTPELQGRVLAISADLFTDERTGNAYYRAEIELPPEERARLGEVTLLPGMPVEAFIRTRDRRPVDYLLEPLTRYLTRAMREG